MHQNEEQQQHGSCLIIRGKHIYYGTII